jgi:hypothetical protein
MRKSPDWSNDSSIIALSNRFERAVSASFAFLEELDFKRCPVSRIDMEDLRDARVTHRFVRQQNAIHLNFSYLTFQIAVVRLSYASPAQCDEAQKPLEAVDFEAWLREHGVKGARKLPWMRKETLSEEMGRSYNRYAANIRKDMEGAVDFLAQRVRESAFIDFP